MKRISKVKTIVFSGALLTLSACGGESIYDLDKPGEGKQVKSEIIDKVGDLEVYEISLMSQGELETSLDYVTVVSAKDEKTVNETTFRLISSTEPVTEVEDNEFFAENYMKGGSKMLNEIDFEIVQQNFEKAKTLIPSDYTNHSLYRYEVAFDEGKRADRLTVNTLLKGEGDHYEGGDIVTNYYEFILEMLPDGSLVIVE